VEPAKGFEDRDESPLGFIVSNVARMNDDNGFLPHRCRQQAGISLDFCMEWDERRGGENSPRQGRKICHAGSSRVKRSKHHEGKRSAKNALSCFI